MRAYELLEWAFLGHCSPPLFRPSDFLAIQEDPFNSRNRDPQAAIERMTAGIEKSFKDPGMSEKHQKIIPTKGTSISRDAFVLKNLRTTENGNPLPIALQPAMRKIFSGYKDKPQRILLQEYLIAARKQSPSQAKLSIEEWSKEGMPYAIFEEALYGYTDFRNKRTSAGRSESGKKGGMNQKAKRRKKRGAVTPGDKKWKRSS